MKLPLLSTTATSRLTVFTSRSEAWTFDHGPPSFFAEFGGNLGLLRFYRGRLIIPLSAGGDLATVSVLSLLGPPCGIPGARPAVSAREELVQAVS